MLEHLRTWVTREVDPYTLAHPFGGSKWRIALRKLLGPADLALHCREYSAARINRHSVGDKRAGGYRAVKENQGPSLVLMTAAVQHLHNR